MKGKIKETSSGLILNVTVRPNSIFSIFGFFFPIAGIFALFATGFGSTTEDGLIAGLTFILIGLFFYPLGRILRNRLRNKFEQYLDLKRVE